MICIGRGTVLDNTRIRITGNNNSIIFGENCHIGKNCSFWMEGSNVHIEIGKGTTFTHSVHFCAQEDNTSINVGEDCMFSNNIIVRTSDSHPIYNDCNDRINFPKSVVIGKHVWIAPKSTIMKGVHIGDGSIVGSDSLVTHDVGFNKLAVGMPAKEVKENIHWTRESLF